MNYNECSSLQESFPLKGCATSLTLPADIRIQVRIMIVTALILVSRVWRSNLVWNYDFWPRTTSFKMLAIQWICPRREPWLNGKRPQFRRRASPCNRGQEKPRSHMHCLLFKISLMHFLALHTLSQGKLLDHASHGQMERESRTFNSHLTLCWIASHEPFRYKGLSLQHYKP